MKQQIVITGSIREFEIYCQENGRDRSNTVQVTQPYQLKMYPDAEIVYYGESYKNACYGSAELNAIENAKASKEIDEILKK